MEPWLGVWNASMPGNKCIQYDHVSYSVQGDEDCLYINVYTPKVSTFFLFTHILYSIQAGYVITNRHQLFIQI